MAKRVDLFDSTYKNFSSDVLDAIRRETFNTDIGQNSWTTVEEYERLIGSLDLDASKHVLEVASGSGGPARFLARTIGCRVTGIDVNEIAVTTASELAVKTGDAALVQFRVADANGALPFEDSLFDALLCIDSMNHFPNRLAVLREWHRVLRPGHRAVFTDPVVITGPITNDDLALRSSIGLFLFVPNGVNEQLIEESGFHLARREDVSDNAALIAERWYRARAARRAALVEFEGEERFEGLQRFFEAVHRLTAARQLSRIAYFVEKR